MPAPKQSRSLRSNWPFVSRTISLAHSKVHTGMHFTFSHLFLSVPNAGNVDIVLSVGAQFGFHAGLGGKGTGDAELRLFEGVDFSGGTPVAAINLNRFSLITLSGSIVHTPTVNSPGTELTVDLIIGGSGGNAVGGEDTEPHRGPEIILASSTNYLLRLTNVSGQARNYVLGGGFYQE